MSWTTRNPTPETLFRGHIDNRTTWPIYRRTGVKAAFCILGTNFGPGARPSVRMRSRLIQALKLIRHAVEPTRVIASGGPIGSGGELTTEAQLIDLAMRQLGIPKLYRDDFSQESVGNIAWTALGLLQPLNVRAVNFITDELHAPRIRAIAEHLLIPHLKVEVTGAPWPLDDKQKEEELRRETAGWSFVERLLCEVPQGDLVGALDWVSENHKSRPYLGIDVRNAVAVIRGQLFDFDTAVGFVLDSFSEAA
jgi:hypothetical protein